VLPLRHPVHTAEEFAQLDCLSGGRFIGGIVRGVPQELVSYNIDPFTSRERFAESYDIVNRCLTEELFDYEGKFYNLRSVSKAIEHVAPDAEVRVTDVYKADQVAASIVKRLGFPFWARDWMRMNQNLFSALKLEKTAMFIILTLIVLVAAFNIASTLIMTVMAKTRDIAILKAMGATNRSIRRIFVLNGMVIGAVGTTLGVVLGATLCALLDRYKFIKLPGDVYYFTTLPVNLRAVDVLVIAVAAMLICFLATLYPANQASRLNPVEAIRYG